MILNPLPIPCDLSESSLAFAYKSIHYDTQTDIKLFVSTALIGVAHKIFKPTSNIFVDDQLDKDEWYLKAKYSGVYSPGA